MVIKETAEVRVTGRVHSFPEAAMTKFHSLDG
jgi:hypothetical protein